MTRVIYSDDIDFTDEVMEEERRYIIESRQGWEDNVDVSDEEVIDSLNRSIQDSFNDELCNLKVETDGKVLAIANLGLWSGRRQGYYLGNNLLSECLTIGNEDYNQLYYDGYNVRKRATHHDGTNHILFREVKPNVDIDKLLNKIYNGEEIDSKTLNYYTKSLRRYVKDIYGW